MGVCYIKADSGKVAVLRKVDVATRFGAGRVATNDVGADVVHALRRAWAAVETHVDNLRSGASGEPGREPVVFHQELRPTTIGFEFKPP